MTFQTDAPLDRLALDARNSPAREWARLAEEGVLDLNPPYQRGHVWSTEQRIGLVRSWLSGIPVPAIMINDRGTRSWADANGSNPLATGESVYAVVDGKQRITTAIMWFNGDLAVPASWFRPEAVVSTRDTEDGPYVTIKDLVDSEQRHLGLTAQQPTNIAQVSSVADEADLYLLVNGGGTAQSQADLDNAAQYATEM